MAESDIDPIIAEYVEQTANRFGVHGLEQMIQLAEAELVVARKALEELADLDE